MASHLPKQLTQSEITDTFVKVLTDTYKLKKLMLDQLPYMTYKTKEVRLKMLIISSGASLETQMLRLNLAMRQLNKSCAEDESLSNEGLDFKKYLAQNVDSISLYNDAKLMHNLMVIVGVEVNSFRLLVVLSKHLYPRNVNRLMKLNLGEAIKYEKRLVATYNTYLGIDKSLVIT
jgi:ferritin-like metal-binding protein YciE